MTIYDYQIRKIPEYYKCMYLDGFKPHEILTALRAKMLHDSEGRHDEPTVVII